MSLHELQSRVHVGKDKRNDFGGYNYRTAEGILAAAKAALPDGASIIVTDDIRELCGQIFVQSRAVVTFADGTSAEAVGFAMHPLTKKGMDPSQITGSASSYARKYALGGLLALDDGSVDPDSAKEPYQPDPTPKADPEPKQQDKTPPQETWADVRDTMLGEIAKRDQSASALDGFMKHAGFRSKLDDMRECDFPKFAQVRKALTDAWQKASGGESPHHKFLDSLHEQKSEAA